MTFRESGRPEPRTREPARLRGRTDQVAPVRGVKAALDTVGSTDKMFKLAPAATWACSPALPLRTMSGTSPPSGSHAFGPEEIGHRGDESHGKHQTVRRSAVPAKRRREEPRAAGGTVRRQPVET